MVGRGAGRSHSAGRAKEEAELTTNGGASIQVLVPGSDSSHAGQKGSGMPFPDPSFILSKGSLGYEDGYKEGPASSEGWLSLKAPLPGIKPGCAGGFYLFWAGSLLWVSLRRSRRDEPYLQCPQLPFLRCCSPFFPQVFFILFFFFS